MKDPGEVTPIDRPLMRSDLDAVRKAVQNIEQVAILHYAEATATRREGRVLSVVCLACAIISVGCSLGWVIP